MHQVLALCHTADALNILCHAPGLVLVSVNAFKVELVHADNCDRIKLEGIVATIFPSLKIDAACGITPPPTPIGRLDLPANYHYELPQHASDWCTISWCKDTPGAIEDPPLVHYELPSKQVRPLSIRQTCWQPNQPHFSHEHHCHCQYHQHRHHLATNKTSVKDAIAAYQHHKHNVGMYLKMFVSWKSSKSMISD